MRDRHRPPQVDPPSTPPSDPAIATTRVMFVDAVEEGIARLVLREDAPVGEEPAGEDVVSFSLPAVLLPEGAREGSWIELHIRRIPPPEGEDPNELRNKLLGGDNGGDFQL